MFSNLTNLAYKRSAGQAVVFYVVYFFGIVIAAMVLGGASGLITGESNFALSVQIGMFVAIIACLGLSFAILTKKGLTGNTTYIALVVLSGVLAYFGGALLGLIPVAFLTTVKR